MVVASSTAAATYSRGPSNGRRELRPGRKAASYRLSLLGLIAIGLLALVWPKATSPVLLWNASYSIPTGLYARTSQAPAKGRLAIIRLPEPERTLAHDRGYLSAGALLIKPVVAGPGNVICRYGGIVSIDGRPRVRAKTIDSRHRQLPRWQKCFRLTASQIFVLSTVPGSFDSRYFGPINRERITGIAVPIWTR